MSYVMFLVTEIIGVLILFFTYKGVFDLVMAFLTVILMLGLSFHVLVRRAARQANQTLGARRSPSIHYSRRAGDLSP